MKQLLKLLAVAVLVVSFTSATAQTKQKFGHINSDELLRLMPGIDSIQLKLQNYKTAIESQLKTMQTEYDNKLNDYMANEAKLSDLLKKTKVEEIKDLEARMQAFANQAQESMQTEQEKLLQPVLTKAKKAIEDVAKENGYSYIFDSVAAGVLLFAAPTDDIMNLVKTKLGIK